MHEAGNMIWDNLILHNYMECSHGYAFLCSINLIQLLIRVQTDDTISSTFQQLREWDHNDPAQVKRIKIFKMASNKLLDQLFS